MTPTLPSTSSPRERASAAVLATVLVFLPFEPRAPLARVLGLNVTWLETVAAGAVLALLALNARRLRSLVPPPAPLLALAALAAAHLLAAAFAPQYRGEATVFSLRLVAALVFAVAVAALPPRVQKRGLDALAVAGAACAALAVVEALGGRPLDPFLDLFRERAFSLGSARRATAGTAGPNIGAAFIAAGLLAGVARLAPRGAAATVGLALGLGAGLLATYSRGGLAAGAAGLAVLAWTTRPRSTARRAVAAALVTLLALAASFLASRSFRPRLAAEWPAALSARFELVEGPPRFTPGEVARVRFRVTNDGAAGWPADPSFRLSVEWYDPAVRRAEQWAAFPFRRGLEAGGSALVEADLRAPARPGPYVLVLDVNSASTGYLSTAGATPGRIPVAVGDAADAGEAPATIPPLRTRRGRLELWRIALVMWRAHPLTGVGPDNFRRLHVEYGEWIAPTNVTVGAHNVFLEAAATTGTAGLLALLAVFASVAAAALRARGSGDPARAGAVLALLTAVGGQGLVDSLLGFTGVYLLFAFVVGLAASLRDRAGPARSGPGSPRPPRAGSR